MPETVIIQPPPNPALAQQASQMARSPLDIAAQQSASPPTDIDAGALAQAQAQDRAKLEGKPVPIPTLVTPVKEEEEPPHSSGHGLEWKPKEKRTADQWKHLKETKEAELAAARAEAAEWKSKVENNPEHTKTKTELAEYRELLKQVAIERDPEFNARFTVKRDAIIKGAKLAAGEVGEDVAKLLNLPASDWRDGQIDMLIEELSEGVKQRIGAARNVLNQIEFEREAEIASKKASFETTQQQAFAVQAQKQKEKEGRMQIAFQETLKEWQDPENGMPLFIANTDQEKKDVAQAIQLAQAIFSGNLTEKELSAAALWAAAGPGLLRRDFKRQEEYQLMKTAYEKLRGVQPGATGQSARLRDQSNGQAPLAWNDPNYIHDFSDRLAAARIADRAAEGR